MPDWSQRVVLITGGSSGLGLALARAWVRRGARVVIAARDAAKLEQAAAGLRSSGGDVRAIAADITVQAGVERLIAETIAVAGRLDVLVNCAGRSTRGEVLAATPEEFQALWELNFLAVVRCTRAAADALIATGGSIVNIGSLASKSAARYLGSYPASKFALAAYNQQLRLELGPRGVHVLLACPGPIARDDAGARYATSASGLPEAANKPGGGVRLKALDPDKLAEKIVAACERRAAELVVPWKAKILFVLSQVSPRLGDWLIGRSTR